MWEHLPLLTKGGVWRRQLQNAGCSLEGRAGSQESLEGVATLEAQGPQGQAAGEGDSHGTGRVHFAPTPREVGGGLGPPSINWFQMKTKC